MSYIMCINSNKSADTHQLMKADDNSSRRGATVEKTDQFNQINQLKNIL